MKNSHFCFDQRDDFKNFFSLQERKDHIETHKIVWDRPIVNMPFHRRNFFIISLIKSPINFVFLNKQITVQKPVLFISNPLLPFSVHTNNSSHSGYICLFNKSFINKYFKDALISKALLFDNEEIPLYDLTALQLDFLSQMFEQMMLDINSDYLYKFELLQNYLCIMIHYTLSIRTQTFSKLYSGSSRIAFLFKQAMESQFPILSPRQVIRLRNPSMYAQHLTIHINHLNAAVRAIFDKTTSQMIAERLSNEAEILLSTTDWTMVEIASCLGFEYVTYFNRFFKKHTGWTPMAYRKAHFFFD